MCSVLFHQTLKCAPQMRFALVMCTSTKYERWYCARHLHLNVLIHFFLHYVYTKCVPPAPKLCSVYTYVHLKCAPGHMCTYEVHVCA